MGLKVIALGLALAPGLCGQEMPRPNRSGWLAILPEPLPDGQSALTLEASSQFLRPDWERTADGRTRARLDGEEWQVTVDFAHPVGPGAVHLRARLVDRSGGFMDQAIATWHGLLGTPGGGRELAPKWRLAYHLERDGVVVADLRHPGQHLMDTDLAYVVSLGTPEKGLRFGASLQLPTGSDRNWSGNGATDGLLGLAGWTRIGPWRFHGQVEQVWIGLPTTSAFRSVLGRRQLTRGWIGTGYHGTGSGFWRGLGLDLSLGIHPSPYRTGIPRIDRPGMQQHWTLTHRALPHWQVGFSEEAGTYVAPDITAWVRYRIR